MMLRAALLVAFLATAYTAKLRSKAQESPYSTPPARLDAIDTCLADNWGMPNQIRKPYRTTYKTDLQDACMVAFSKGNMQPMTQVLANATVNYYLNNKDFDKFVGVDLVPDNHHLYERGGFWGHNLEYKHVRRDYMRAANCEAEQPDGSTWTATRIGPFRTKGGYDWTQVGWDNLWDMHSKLLKHPHGIYVLEQFSGAVTADGTRIGNPPIHVHHIHVGPSPGVRQRADAMGCLMGKACYDPSRIFEQHGDYQCSGVPDDPENGAASGDLDCFTESVPDGYGKLLTRPLGVEGDINDIREPNSTALEWYYQLAARWVPKLDCSEYPQTSDDDETDTDIADVSAASTATPLADTTSPVQEAHSKKKKKSNKKEKLPSAMYPRPKAMSFHNFAGPGFVDKTQSSLVFTHRVPTDVESIFWYSGRMHHSGSLLRLKQHAHNIIYKESIFFAATPAQLGLTKENKLMPAQPYQVVRTKDAGFENNVELRKFLLHKLKKSRETYDAHAESGRSLRTTHNTSSSSHASLSSPVDDHGPRAICHAIHSFEYIDGFMYDRREPTCCVPWTFTKGDIFTVVGFNKIVTEKGALYQGDRPGIAPFISGHINWWISYDTHEVPEKSHFSLIQYTNNPNVQFEDFVNFHEDRLMFLFNGGTSLDRDSISYRLFRKAVFVYQHPFVVPLFVVFCVLSVRLVVYLRKTMLFVMYEGNVMEGNDVEMMGLMAHQAQD